ncbi:AfsA-related hotdog domain-containing protein [Kitasatospora sp. NPDC057015]|uniref:AfsA-related hotdog domain-containing protein n=1 Tax=Kitasatospora sp. NPDC057015 TaxID=3346001 RepID=UPI0036427246
MAATVFVVGDRFAAFAEQTGARTVSGLVAELRAGVHDAPGGGEGGRPGEGVALVLAEGQGVSAYDWALVRDELERRGLSGRTRIVADGRGEPAGRSETHKHREQNVLVAGLTRTGERTFRAELRIHNDQELQLDHQASHVQGMVVLEAARQMYLAVCERHYGPDLPGRDYAYVYDKLETTFRNFLFPLDATIECEVLAADLSDPELLTFDIAIDFRQAGLRIAAVRIAGSGFDRALMARKEVRAAQRALRYALKHAPAAAGSEAPPADPGALPPATGPAELVGAG